MKKTYNKFFAISIATSFTSLSMSQIDGVEGLLIGVAATAGLIAIDNYLLDRILSETTINLTNIFKPKINKKM